MKRFYVSLLAALILIAPSLVLADDSNSHQEVQQSYLQTADEYLWKANDLQDKQAAMTPEQQWIVAELIDIYYGLSDTKVSLAKAIGAADRAREEQLEHKYFALKEEEERLWDNLDGTKH